MPDRLEELVDREQLHYVQAFHFPSQAGARALYLAMLRGDVPVPLKCAVVLLRQGAAYSAALFIGRSFRIPEMPKPLDEAWSWSQYLDTAGLPATHEWSECKACDFPGLSRFLNRMVVVDFFVSEALKSGRYRCLACDAAFASYDELFDGHVLRTAGHDKLFNDAVLAQLPVVVNAAEPTTEQALAAARKQVPAGAEILRVTSTEPSRHARIDRRPSGTGETRDAAVAAARRHLPLWADNVQEIITSTGGQERTLTVSIDLDALSSNERSAIEKCMAREVPSPFVFDYTRTQNGSPGFLGLGRKPAVFEVNVRSHWAVELDYEEFYPATAELVYRRPG